jgi:hypothetical protein
MTALAIWPKRPRDKWQHRFSIECPQAASALSLHQTANRKWVRSSFHRNHSKRKQLQIDSGELLIEIAQPRSLLGRLHDVEF